MQAVFDQLKPQIDDTIFKSLNSVLFHMLPVCIHLEIYFLLVAAEIVAPEARLTISHFMHCFCYFHWRYHVPLTGAWDSHTERGEAFFGQQVNGQITQ